MIRATGSKTDYSPSARAASLSTLHAFLLKGATTFELGKVDISHFGLQKLITENPVAATAVFKALMETVWSCLLGVEPDRLSRRTVPLGSSPNSPREDLHQGVVPTDVACHSCISSTPSAMTSFSKKKRVLRKKEEGRT